MNKNDSPVVLIKSQTIRDIRMRYAYRHQGFDVREKHCGLVMDQDTVQEGEGVNLHVRAGVLVPRNTEKI